MPTQGRTPTTLAAIAAVACLAALLPATAAAKPRPTCKPSTIAAASALPRKAATPRLARAAVCLINRRRVARGLRRLRLNRRLSRAARRHTRDMVRRRYFGHVSRNGADVVDRLRRSRYIRPNSAWAVGENLAWGSGRRATPRRIVRAWMRSPGHRANILSPRFREIGIGVTPRAPVRTKRPAATYTTTFGSRR